MKIDAQFRTSSFCASTNCVQVAIPGDGRVALRDSKNAVPTHLFPIAEWTRFTAAIKRGDLTASPVA